MCTFAKRLKDLRIERGLTQEKLANLADISVRTIKRYEEKEGKYPQESSQSLRNLAEIFGVYSTWLLTGKGYKNAWEELQESAKTSTTHKWVVEARIKALNELKKDILKYYHLPDTPLSSADMEGMTHAQWEQAEKEYSLLNVTINNIFNYMDMAVANYHIRLSDMKGE